MLDALNLTDSLPGISKMAAEDAIEKFTKDKWLHTEKEGNFIHIYLGVRTMLELRSWLEDIYTLTECVMCSELVLRVTQFFLAGNFLNKKGCFVCE